MGYAALAQPIDPDSSRPVDSDCSEASVALDPEVLDPDLLDDLGDEIATLFAHMHAATQRSLVLIARFDRLRGWEPAGHQSCAHWLHVRAGLDLGTAREHVRVARALEDLPKTGASMAQGKLSFSKVRALTRVAETSSEADLLELAEGCTAAQLERMVRAWKKHSRQKEIEWEELRHESRTFSVFPDDDGMYVVRGRLDPEVGAILMRAVEAASDALYDQHRKVREAAHEAGHGDAYENGREAARRRADAVGLLAERALAARSEPPRPTWTRARPPTYRSAALGRSATRWCSMWIPTRCRRIGSRAARSSRTGPAFPRKRLEDSPATPASSVSPVPRTGRCSTWGGGGVRFRPPYAGPSTSGTGDVASPAVGSVSPRRTT